MDSPAFLRHQCANRLSYGVEDGTQLREGVRHECYSPFANLQSSAGAVVGVDIAEAVFQLCEADTKWQRKGKHRLTRAQFERWFDNRDVALVVMEACGTAHYWARWLISRAVDVGLLTTTAMAAATGGDVTHFKGKGSRGFACWFGITPRETSSGQKRRLGSISKQGDTYLRTLLVHGARSALTAAAAAQAQAQGKPLDSLKRWALQLQARVGHNKAACALANKMARICYACLRDGQPYQAKMA